MLCSKCGEEQPDSSNFCSKCGTNIASQVPLPQPPKKPERISESRLWADDWTMRPQTPEPSNTARSVLGNIWLLIKIGIVAGIALLVWGGYVGSMKDDTKPPLKVDLDAFYAQGNANPAALKEQLGKRLLEIHGHVGGIGMDMDRPKVDVVTKDGSLSARMIYDGGGAASLTKDQEVTMVCEDLKYSGTHGSSGSECKVVNAGSITTGITHDLKRRQFYGFVGGVLIDTAKGMAEDLRDVASVAKAMSEDAAIKSDSSSQIANETKEQKASRLKKQDERETVLEGANAKGSSEFNARMPVQANDKPATIQQICPRLVSPGMPRKALQDGTEGVVKAQIHIKGGIVEGVEILSGPKVFHDAVKAAVMQYGCVSDSGDVTATQEFTFKVE